MPKKILIVDNEEDLRDFLVRLLERNYDTLSAKDGSEALNISRENPDLSLILMDTDMPNLNGDEVCKILRKEGCNIPIIGMSGHYDNKERWQQAESNDFIEKPFSNSSISEKVKAYLGE
mgnify:CR=1 FL=1